MDSVAAGEQVVWRATLLHCKVMPAMCRAYKQPSPPQPGSLVLWIDIIDVALSCTTSSSPPRQRCL
jgi:hypothetical protein